MKTIKKLLATAALATGLVLGAQAHAGFITGTILVKEHVDTITQEKSINQIVIALGEKHTYDDQTNYLKTLHPLLQDRKVKFILEGKSEDAKRINYEEKQSVLDRLCFYARNPNDNPAAIELCDWRTGNISVLIDFFISVDGALDRLKHASIKSIDDLGGILHQDYLPIQEELESLEPWMIANDICQNNFEDYPEPVLNQLNANYDYLINAITEDLKQRDFTVGSLEKEFQKNCGSAIKEKDLKNTPKTTKLSDDLIGKLKQSLQEVKKQCGSDPNQKILSYLFNRAVRKENFEPITTSVLFETPWFKTLIDALGDYGLIIGTKKSTAHNPVTVVLAGGDHIKALLAQFKEKEQYTEYYSLQIQDDQEELTSDEFKALFEKLSEIRKEQTTTNKKRKLELDSQIKNLEDDETPHKQKLNKLKDAK